MLNRQEVEPGSQTETVLAVKRKRTNQGKKRVPQRALHIRVRPLCLAELAIVASLFLSIGICKAQQPVMTNLDLWLKADAGVTADSSGNVSAWADQSGNNHGGSQSTLSAQPLLVTNALNGLPTLRFNGSGQFLGVSGQVINSQQFTIMAVVNDSRLNTDTSFREVFSNWSSVTFDQSAFLGTANNTPVRARFTDDMGGANDPNNTQTGVGTISNPASPFVFTGISDTSDATIYQGSTAIANKGSALSVRNLSAVDGPYNVGTQGGFEFWQGDITEILVYDSALSSSQFQQNLGYLQGKYFTPADVPEPGSVALLLGMGICSAGFLLRRRSR